MRKVLPVVIAMSLFVASVVAVDLGELLKVFGIGYVITRFAKPLNKFINTVLTNNKMEAKEATKVVPIVSMGTGLQVGAAQVSGQEDLLKQVKAALQLETEYEKVLRVRILIPINTTNPLRGDFKRIYGVGLTALIDVKPKEL